MGLKQLVRLSACKPSKEILGHLMIFHFTILLFVLLELAECIQGSPSGRVVNETGPTTDIPLGFEGSGTYESYVNVSMYRKIWRKYWNSAPAISSWL